MINKIRLNNTQLKYIAAVFMFIDHFSLLFLDYGTTLYFVGRGLGRLSAPIFFWSLSVGAFHTKNIKKYFLNILIFGIVIQLAYILAMGDINSLAISLGLYKNIFITLTLGLFAIIFIKKFINYPIIYISTSLIISIVGELIKVDYGWYGVTMIILFYLFKENRMNLVISLILINMARFALEFNSLPILPNLLQLISLLTIPLIFLYDGKRGSGNKYFFYFFYPTHLAGLYLLKSILEF